MTLMGLGIAAVVMVWLVFSVLKKVIGFAFLIALVIAGFMLWQNPAMLASLTDWVQGFFS